jgi:hypothetical protein
VGLSRRRRGRLESRKVEGARHHGPKISRDRYVNSQHQKKIFIDTNEITLGRTRGRREQ